MPRPTTTLTQRPRDGLDRRFVLAAAVAAVAATRPAAAAPISPPRMTPEMLTFADTCG